MPPPCHFCSQIGEKRKGSLRFELLWNLTNDCVSMNSLDDNNIGDAGAKDIAAALEVNTTLKWLT